MKRILLVLPLPIVLLLVGIPGQAGGGKASPWKSFLPDVVYKELTTRSIKVIEESAKAADKDAHERIELEAAILAGYTLSAKNPQDDSVSTMRGAALQASVAVHKNDFKRLAEFGKMIKSAPKAPAEVKDWKPYLHELEDLMLVFKNKAKRGEGLHQDLQYHPKLKNLNGIEALIGALGAKKLSEENVAKVSKELPLLAYRIAVVAELTHEFAPEKDGGKWREFAIQMRDTSIAMAEAAQKKNGDGVLKAAQGLENSCTQCHRDYRNK